MHDSPELFRKATELAELGQLDQAFAMFHALLKTDSNNAPLWNNIGIIQFRQGNYLDAVNAFGQATDIDSHFTSAWFNKSLALVHLGKDIEALRALDKVLKLNPNDNEVQSQRALIVQKMAQVSDTKKEQICTLCSPDCGYNLEQTGCNREQGRVDSIQQIIERISINRQK